MKKVFVTGGLLNTSINDTTLAVGPQVAGEEEYNKALAAKDVLPDFTKDCDLAIWLASQESNGITGKLISVHHDYRSLKP